MYNAMTGKQSPNHPIQQIRVLKSITFLLLTALFSLTFANTEPDFQQDDIGTYISHWSGIDQLSGENKTILFYQIIPGDLIFTAGAEGYTARYEIHINLVDENGEHIDDRFQKETIQVADYAESLQSDWFCIGQAAFSSLQDGRHKATIVIRDQQSEKSTTIIYEFGVSVSQTDMFDLSDVQLAAQYMVDLTADANESDAVLPYPLAIYGNGQEQLFYYFEIYAPKEMIGDSMQLAISYINEQNEDVIVDESVRPILSTKQPVFSNIDTGNLPAGKYHLIANVNINDAVFTVERQIPFYVYQSPIDLRYKSFDDVLQELEYIANKTEIEALREIPEGERQAAIDSFWVTKDPTPETVLNEVMTEYYRRIEFAKVNFWTGKSDGFMSDRGKVYMKYGMPNKIFKQDLGYARTHQEIWHYDRAPYQVRFTYKRAFDDYVLVEPMAF